MRILLYFLLSSTVCWLLWRYSKPFANSSRKWLARILTCVGLTMAMAIGTATHFVFPGIGSIAISAVSGALVGWIIWLIIGTIGIAPLGIAVGLWSMVLAATSLSMLGGFTGGIGLRTVIVPYVPFGIWVPILATAWIIRRESRKQEQLPALPVNDL